MITSMWSNSVPVNYHTFVHNCVGVHHLYLISLEAGTSIHLGLKSPGILLRSVYSAQVLMRDEKEGRKKQARTNKQQGKATQHTQSSHKKLSGNLHVPHTCTCTCTECNTATHIHPINKVGSSKKTTVHNVHAP